jgi:hypothetical protein
VGRAVTGTPWWRALPAVETWVPCGDGTHPVRWADGTFSLPAHEDLEAEAVLAALGGEKAACVEVSEAWHRHTGDLEVLAVGPRGPDDEIKVSWDDVREFREGRPGGGFTRQLPGGSVVGSAGPLRGIGRPGSRPMIRAGAGGGPGAFRVGRPAELERLRAERLEMLTLLALGHAFQFALSGVVAAGHAAGGARAAEVPDHRPALEAALTGRLAPAAAAWLGLDPDLVDARLLEGPPHQGAGAGGGELELTGAGPFRRLHAMLPVSWLATVWAPGLALVDGHLVVAVEQAAWPDATVRAVPAPGRVPVRLGVRATEGEPAHWEITERREADQA